MTEEERNKRGDMNINMRWKCQKKKKIMING